MLNILKMKLLNTITIAAALTLSVGSTQSIKAQEFIDMSGFGQLQSDMATPVAPSPPTKTTQTIEEPIVKKLSGQELKNEYCEANEATHDNLKKEMNRWVSLKSKFLNNDLDYAVKWEPESVSGIRQRIKSLSFFKQKANNLSFAINRKCKKVVSSVPKKEVMENLMEYENMVGKAKKSALKH